jgi:hypothetical protein
LFDFVGFLGCTACATDRPIVHCWGRRSGKACGYIGRWEKSQTKAGSKTAARFKPLKFFDDFTAG